jgi:murein DD-endopeptidase MepM/ murein hydrolase activator NlpD
MSVVRSVRAPKLDRSSWIGLGVLVFLIGGARSGPLAPLKLALAGTSSGSGPSALGAGECPNGTAPDGNACVHLETVEDGPVAPSFPNAHRERSGRWFSYEQIPRLPDRPSDYDAYRYPIPPGLPNGHYVVSGYDLDKPDEHQRRGPTLKHVGHGGVDLPQTKGTPVKLVALEHQEGEAEVLYAGGLFGLTVLTRQTLREGGRLRDYVVLFGHLDTIAPGVHAGMTLKEGDLVGTVGDSGSPRIVHLHLEIRRVRDGVDIAKVAAGAMMIADSVTVVSDPRNVLPLK